MDAAKFEEVFERVTGQSRDVLVEKAKEYAGDGDRLHNFKKSAAGEGITPEQALWGFLLKHWVSLSDMVKSGKAHPAEKWDEKIGDAINYLILLQAIVEERASDVEFDKNYNHVAMPATTYVMNITNPGFPIDTEELGSTLRRFGSSAGVTDLTEPKESTDV